MWVYFKEKGQRFKSTLGKISYQHGKLCAKYPLVVLTLVFTLINCLSSPALYHIFVNSSGPNVLHLLEMVSTKTYPNFSKFTKLDGENRNPYGLKTLVLEQIYITGDKPVFNGRGMVTKYGFDFLLELQSQLKTFSISNAGSETFLKDFCFINLNSKSCLQLSPFNFPNQKFARPIPFESTQINEVYVNPKVQVPVGISYSNLKLNEKGEVLGASSLILTYFFQTEETSQLLQLWDTLINGCLNSLQQNTTFNFKFQSRNDKLQKTQTFQLVEPSYSLSAEATLLGLGYLTVILYLLFSINQIKLVKSKFWLGFASVFILNVSLLMAFGITLLCRYQLTLIPWQIIPFLIIAIGAENILRITNAVVSTSLDLPVKERIGKGLEKCGYVITLHLAVELCVLLAATLSTNDALRQFGVFGALAVTLDYVLQLTFFLAVLAIDIRRMELSDLQDRCLYREGSPTDPTRSNRRLSTELDESFMLAHVWESLLERYRSLSNYPLFKMASLLGSLALAWLLTKSLQSAANLDQAGLQSNWIASPANLRLDTSWWFDVLHANYGGLVQVRSPTCIVLEVPPDPFELNASQIVHQSGLFLSQVNRWYLLVTTFLFSFISFYIWLLYQVRDQPRNDWTIAKLTRRLQTCTPFYTDINLLCSNNHELVLAVSLQNELMVWNYFVDRILMSTTNEELGLRAITKVAISKNGCIAVSDATGLLKFSELVTNTLSRKTHRFDTVIDSLTGGIKKLIFLENFPHSLLVLSNNGVLAIYDLKTCQLAFTLHDIQVINVILNQNYLFLGCQSGQLVKMEIIIESSKISLRQLFTLQKDYSPLVKLGHVKLDMNADGLSWCYPDGTGYLTLISNNQVDQLQLIFIEANTQEQTPSKVQKLQLFCTENRLNLIRRLEDDRIELHLFELKVEADSTYNLSSLGLHPLPTWKTDDFSVTLEGNLVGLQLDPNRLKWDLRCLSLSKITLSTSKSVDQPTQVIEICDDPLSQDEPVKPTSSSHQSDFAWLPFDKIDVKFVSLKQSNCFAAAMANRIVVVEPSSLLKLDFEAEPTSNLD